MNKPKKNYAKWKEPDTEDQILYHSLYKILNIVKSIEIKSRLVIITAGDKRVGTD